MNRRLAKAHGKTKSIWKELLACARENKTHKLHESNKKADPEDWFYSPSHGLGWSLRARISVYSYCKAIDHALTYDEIDETLREHQASRSAGKITSIIASNNLCTPSKFCAKPVLTSSRDEVIYFIYNHSFAKHQNLSVDTFHDLFLTTPFFGDDAVEDFLAWLSTGLRPPITRFDHCPDIELYDLRTRLNTLRQIVGHLQRKDCLPVQVVHCPHNPNALTALASYMHRGDWSGLQATASARSVELRTSATETASTETSTNRSLLGSAGRPYCYISCTRNEGEELKTLPLIVAELHAFFSSAHPSKRVKPIFGEEEYNQAVEYIRNAMMHHPVTLVFDRYCSVRGRHTGLPNFITDNSLPCLLRQLLTPRIREGSMDLTTFYKTRILVLSDDAETQISLMEQETSIGIPSLTAGSQRNLLQIASEENREILARASRYNPERLGTEVMVRLADTWLKLVDAENLEEDPGAALEGILRRDNTPSSIGKDLIAKIHDTRPLDLVLLRWIALAESEMRADTLTRLVMRRRRADRSWCAKAFPPGDQDPDAAWVIDHLSPYSQILISGPDEFIEGLDGEYLPTIGKHGKIGRSEEATPISYAFATTELHNQFYSFGREDSDLEDERLLLYRLLAEEAFWQQAEIKRHSFTTSMVEVGVYRRLAEGLHYGHASLPDNLGRPVSGLEATERSLPLDPWETFQRLYHVFYRDILQSAPRFDLTRNKGRPSLAADLLVSALWSGVKNPPDNRTEVIPADIGPYQAPETAELQSLDNSAHFATAQDIFLSTARNLLQANRLEQCGEVLEVARIHLDKAPDETLKSTYDLSLRKVEIDLDLLSFNAHAGGDIDAITTLCRNTIQSFSPDGANALSAITDALRLFSFAPKVANAWQETAEVFAFHEVLKKRVDSLLDTHMSSDSVKALERVSDFYARFAEGKALAADAIRDPRRAIKPFLIAWACFFATDRIHRKIFRREPISYGYHPNPHSLRVMIRVDLKLQRFFAKHADKGTCLDTGETGEPEATLFTRKACEALAAYFAYQAQKHLNILTRYTNNFAAEQPSLLMLEAGIARSVHRQPHAALRLLARADELINHTMDRPRLTFRLAIERAKTLRQLASIASTPEEANAALSAARLESKRLSILTSRDTPAANPHRGQRLWSFIAQQQAEAG
ncbi:MAG: hypothetical protein QUV02_02235 [Maricaulis sp.]|uniref:hypothetical protein n=1 Tax=Maricaulis sp. TaxID=1486257 RepID=UPI002634C288|nr:hypothetical protein [Maricaulis sp.]MDM7983240.1 hypothetical protein [Maricaulis sp.]